MMNKGNWISILRDGGNVQRFHTTNLIKSQDVAQHSFSCALLAEHLAHYIDDVDPAKVMLHMLVHDIPETAIGDMPWKVKRDNKELYAELNKAERKWSFNNLPTHIYDNLYYEGFTENEKALCKFVDQFEALLKAKEEIEMGNRTLEFVLEAMFRECYSIILKNPDFDALYEVMSKVDRETYDVSK